MPESFSLAAHSRLDDEADALLLDNANAAKARAPIYLGDEAFWRELFADEVPEFMDEHLATCFTNLTEACKGDEFARDRICAALHRIERLALPLAERALKDIFDREGR